MQSNPNASILILDENGTNLGNMSYQDAKLLASSRDLDLVQINKNERTQVFKIMDHGKWKYEQKKNKNKQKKPTHHLKEMNFKMRIDPHDLEIKVNRIKSFLDKGDDVKLSVTMRGRERATPRLAHEKMDAVLAQLEGLVLAQQRRVTNNAVFVSVRPVGTPNVGKTDKINKDIRAVDREARTSDVDDGKNNGRGMGKPRKL